METNDASEVTVSSTSEECSETTVEIKLKTLDSQTYTLRVNKSMPVPALKEQIANVTGVLSEEQRLICHGKVLKDDQLLSAYHVEDGHTLHLVVRHPLSSTTGSAGPASAPIQPDSNPAASMVHNHNGSIGHSVVFGTVNLADQGDPLTSELTRVLSSLIGSLGITNFGTGGERNPERPEGESGNVSVSNPAQSQSNQGTAGSDGNSQQRAFRSPGADPTVIPDSLTTLYQYLNHMRHEFNTSGGGHSSDAQNGEAQDHSAHLHSPLGQGGLPTPASLAEVLLSARQLLIEHAGECLSELARQLEGQTSVTDPLARRDIQYSAIRSGNLLQSLGSLLLELGRATVTLRMGQTPSEAVVNAGPAIFISSSGPNPLMVQAGTTFGGIPMGSIHTGHGLAGGIPGSGFLSRNIDIRIRRGHSVPVATANLGDQAAVRHPPGLIDPASTTGDNSDHQALQGASGTTSVSGEPGVRVVPVRTVVAVPAGASRHPSNSSGSSVGLFYPLLARFQQQNSRNLNNARSSQVSVGQHSISGTGQQQISDLTTHSQNLESTTAAAGRDANLLFTNTESAQHQQGTLRIFNSSRQGSLDGSNNDGTQTHEVQQSGQDSLSQVFSRIGQIFGTVLPGEQIQINDVSLQTTATGPSADERGTIDAETQVSNDEGVFFSGLVRQLMPLISQRMTETPSVLPGSPSSSTEQAMSENAADARNSQHHRDPPTPPDSKRLKRE